MLFLRYCYESVSKDDKTVLILTSKRTEYSIIDIGILQTDTQGVSIYPKVTADD
jgi:long-subunit acyl-CoA synthetase (AMP-forming)